MFTFVNDVFVGKGGTGSINSATVGSIFAVNENNQVVANAAGAQSAKTLQIVRVIGKTNIVNGDGVSQTVSVVQRSDELKRNEVFTPVVVMKDAAPAIEQVTTVDFAANIPASSIGSSDMNRVVVRILFKDIEGTKTQITRSFDYVYPANTSLNGSTLATTIARRINATISDLVVATVSGSVMTLTGVPDPTDQLKDWTSRYAQVEFKVAAYIEPMTGIRFETSIGEVETTTYPNKGMGTPALVRDRERSGLPYQGNTNFIGFPEGTPGLTVDMSKMYDVIIVEYNKKYRSSQAQFIESTPKSIEIYSETGTNTVLEEVITAFFA